MKEFLNVIIFIAIAIFANGIVKYFNDSLVTSLLADAAKYSAVIDTTVLAVITYGFPLLAVALTLGAFHFLHFKNTSELSGEKLGERKIRSSKTKSIWFLGIFFVFFVLNKGSILFYKLGECSGGVGSGITCEAGYEGIVATTQMLSFMISLMGIGFYIVQFLFYGLYYLGRYFVLKKRLQCNPVGE